MIKPGDLVRFICPAPNLKMEGRIFFVNAIGYTKHLATELPLALVEELETGTHYDFQCKYLEVIMQEFKLGSLHIKVGDYINKQGKFAVKITELQFKPGDPYSQLIIRVNKDYYGVHGFKQPPENVDITRWEKGQVELIEAIVGALNTRIELDIEDGTYKSGYF